jgi:hypothetical protein
MVNFISTLGTMIVTLEENNLGEKTPLSEITNIETPTVPLSLPKEGGEDGDLNPLLVLAFRDHKFHRNSTHLFVFVLSIWKTPSSKDRKPCMHHMRR